MRGLKGLYKREWDVVSNVCDVFKDSYYLSQDGTPFFWVVPIRNKERLSEDKAKKLINQLEYMMKSRKHRVFPIVVSKIGYDFDIKKYEEFNVRFETEDYVEELRKAQKEDKSYIELLPHNKTAYREALEKWNYSKRVAVVQPTGSGKTFLILKLMEHFEKKKKFVIAPSHYILNQTKKSNENATEDTEYLTYQKLLYLTVDEIEEIKKNPPSLIVLDEFHRAGAESWEKGIQKLLEWVPEAYVLGVTATPIRFLDKEKNMAEDLFASNLAQNLSLPEAIAKEILPMPKYVSGVYGIGEEVQNFLNKAEKMVTTSLRQQVIKDIKNFKTRWELKNSIPKLFNKHLNSSHSKFIIFFKNLAHLEGMKQEIASWFAEWDKDRDLKLYTINSSMADKENEATLKLYEDATNKEIHLMFAIDMLNEGLHIKGVDGLILLRSTISPTLYLQQIGRLITPFTKEDTVIFDLVNNLRNIEEIKFIEDLKQAASDEAEKRRRNGLFKKNLNFNIFDYTIEAKDFSNMIDVRLNTNFDVFYEQLVGFYREHGHSNVPDDWADNPKLATWVRSLRNRHKKGNLAEYELRKLDEIGFTFSVHEKTWWEKFEKLKKFHEEHGHARVPQNEENKELSNWVMVQRRNYKLGKLPQEKIDMLNELQFIWNVEDETWNNNYQNLKRFYENEGHSLVKESHPDKTLYSFVRRMRGKRSKLQQEKIELLNELDFAWSVFEQKWQTQFQQLKKYFEEHGTSYVTESYHGEEEASLGTWVIQQRKKYRQGKLSEEKKRKLDSINFVWDVQEVKK